MAVPQSLGPAKVVLLAVHYATQADIDGLSNITAQYTTVLSQDLLLRILLTHLPETLRPDTYIPILQAVAANEPPTHQDQTLDTIAVDTLSDERASKKIKKLKLLHLTNPGIANHDESDSLTTFLFLRGYRMDEEAGMLLQLPDLLIPFLQRSSALETWFVSTVLPLLRRNHEYYPHKPTRYSLREFEELPDRAAVDYLLAETGISEDGFPFLGRDLRGLIGPWLFNDSRWTQEPIDDPSNNSATETVLACPGWEQTLEWLIKKAPQSWSTVLKVIEQWDGPQDVDLVDDVNLWFQEPQQRYLDSSYARAVLASAYLISDATPDALEGAYKICARIKSLMDQDLDTTLQLEASALTPVPQFDANAFAGAKAATYMRNDLLKPSNPLTTLDSRSISLLMTLIISAFLLTRAGIPCTVRRAGDLAILQDQREQKAELTRLIRTLSAHASQNDDEYWIRARKEIRWLHNWGNAASSEPPVGPIQGVFGTVSPQNIETEILKVLLSNGRYSLARSIYEDASETPLPATEVQNTVQHSALAAFDNASNPNRSRGGLKKCDEIIHAFPKTMDKGLPCTKQIEALLKATHALSDYRLVLKQGEPFSPVVLRVHSDPISVIEKVLEQNKKAYTRLQEFLELGNNMANAGLPTSHKPVRGRLPPKEQGVDSLMIEKRIVAMCIEGALREDDFETAYSYVVSRLGTSSSIDPEASEDEWSWKAALDAGKYVRTERSQDTRRFYSLFYYLLEEVALVPTRLNKIALQGQRDLFLLLCRFIFFYNLVDRLETFLKQFPVFPNAFLIGGPADIFVIELTDQIQKLKVEPVLLHYLSQMKFLQGLELRMATSTRLKACLYSFTSPGGPMNPTRAVRHAAWDTLDLLFPVGRYPRHLISLFFRLLYPWYWPSSCWNFVVSCTSAIFYSLLKLIFSSWENIKKPKGF